MKMEAVCSYKMSVNFNQAVWYQIPEHNTIWQLILLHSSVFSAGQSNFSCGAMYTYTCPTFSLLAFYFQLELSLPIISQPLSTGAVL
jgi:hypothetical protein